MDLGLGRWIYMVLRQHGSAWCLSGPLKRLAYSRIDLSLLQHQSTGYLRTRGDRRLCMRLVHVSFTVIYSCIIIPLYEMLHDRPFSVTSEESLRTT